MATDLAPEFGRDAIWQVARVREDRARHALPNQLGGRALNGGRTLAQYLDLLAAGWIFRTTRLTEEYTLDDWQAAREGALPLAVVRDGKMWFVGRDEELSGKPGMRIISMLPPEIADRIRRETEDAAKERETARAEARAVRKGDGEGSDGEAS